MKQAIAIVTVVFALLTVGGITGYVLSNNSPTDDADAMTESEINEILSGYAKDLIEKGGAIACGQGKMTIKAGTEIKVENGALVFEAHNDPFHATYYVPYSGIDYIYVNI